MTKNIDNLEKIRHFLIDNINELSAEQLNKVPPGFNNNIIWNLGHLVSAQQGICYVRSGLPVIIEEKYFTEYKSGTRPGLFVPAEDIQKIKELLFSTIDRLTHDLEKNAFAHYPGWASRYGVEINNIDDALVFIQYHEGFHSGTILALKRLVV
ncbi:MAG: DinB family protein [Ginsengibacter sp.]